MVVASTLAERSLHQRMMARDISALAEVYGRLAPGVCAVAPPIRLAYFGGRRYRQVAEELDVPEGTVKSRIRSGWRRMSQTMYGERVMVPVRGRSPVAPPPPPVPGLAVDAS